MTMDEDIQVTPVVETVSPGKAEVVDRLSRIFENFMKLGKHAQSAAQYKDAAAAFQLAGNVALTIASIKDQSDTLQNDLSASIQFDDD